MLTVKTLQYVYNFPVRCSMDSKFVTCIYKEKENADHDATLNVRSVQFVATRLQHKGSDTVQWILYN